jgi:hypothetical protein
MTGPPLHLYPFRLHDALTGKWYRARWKGELYEIEKLGRVVDGEPEIRERTDWASGFAPYREPPRTVDALAATIARRIRARLTRVFLRRYNLVREGTEVCRHAERAARLFRTINQTWVTPVASLVVVNVQP